MAGAECAEWEGVMVDRDDILVVKIAIGVTLAGPALGIVGVGMIWRDGWTVLFGGVLLFIGVLLLLIGLSGWKK
jgi:hypothetical protein